MTTLLEQLLSDTHSNEIDSLGYTKNPFPPRGQVQDEVYVPRAELAPVVESLARFLKGDSAGRTWAIAGESGVGKSNFLRHLSRQLDEVQKAGISGIAYRYMTSQQLTPRQLTESIATAVGLDAFTRLIAYLPNSQYRPSSEIDGTALGEYLMYIVKGNSSVPPDSTAKFTMRWLGGQQTYAPERTLYGITMRERIPPAVALPWLRHVLDLMQEQGILKCLVLLLDEFEDVQSLTSAVQNDYLMTLKGLINAFNLDRLFLVLAGQPTAFDRMGQRFPSLKTRWEIVNLEPLRRPEDAIKLVRQYQEYEHRLWLAGNQNLKPKTDLRPNELEIKAIFGELLADQPTRGVTQRDLLSRLHDWIEARASAKVK